MNYSFNQNADLSDSVRIGAVITHCPSCGQIVSNLSYSNFRGETWTDYSNAGLQHCYCPTCHLMLEGWFRMKLNLPPELCAVRWVHSQVSGLWETTDQLFGEPIDPSRGQLVANWIHGNSGSYAYMMKRARYYRKLSGPQFVKDEDRFTVGIPAHWRSENEARLLLDSVKKMLKNKKCSKLTSEEIKDDVLWADFRDTTGLYHVSTMWQKAELPADVTFWRYNDGRPYQDLLWDPKTDAPAVHASVSGQEVPREECKRAPSLSDGASVTAAATWLDARLSELADEQPELSDTRNRDELSAFLDHFISGAMNDNDWIFSLDDANAEKRLSRFLKTFWKVASPLAEQQRLSPEQRAQILRNGGTFLEEIMS